MVRTSNANAMPPHRMIWVHPGKKNKNIIKTVIRNGREFQLHATKGWRSYRLAKV